MLQFEELKLKLEGMKPEIDDLASALGLGQMRSEIQQLENRAAEPGFWDDMENSQKILQRTANLKGKVEKYEKLEARYEDALALIELGDEAEDESLIEEAQAELDGIRADIDRQRLETLLTGEYDKNNAILTFHAGSGGTEAQDWAEMLYRMYTRWAAAHGFNVKEIDYLDGDEAGLKSAVLLIEGENAYGYLKSEAGVHRLVRVSPFDSAGRRHTSGQQDLLRRSSDPYPDGNRGRVSGRALSVSEPRRRDEDAHFKAHGDQGTRAPGEDRGYQGRPEGDHLGLPDPLLRFHALHPRQGSPYLL